MSLGLLAYFRRNGHFGELTGQDEKKELAKYKHQLNADGIDVEREWKNLKPIDPNWRRQKLNGFMRPSTPSEDVVTAFRNGQLHPIIFSDVDHAIMGRDAQFDADQKIMELSTLEILGFVAHHFNDLQNREITLNELQDINKKDLKDNKALGQQLFKWALTTIRENNLHLVKDTNLFAFEEIAEKNAADLTNDDFNFALGSVNDALYQLVIDPLSHHLSDTTNVRFSAIDAQSGDNRMLLIYKIMSAISHVAPDQKSKFRHEDFFLFELQDHIYPGVEDFFREAREAGAEVVAITRGSHLPYMKTFEHGLSKLFDRVYSSLLWSARNPNKPERDEDQIFFPKKKFRPYSTRIDHIDSKDKLRVMFHEALQQFHQAGLDFKSKKELNRALMTFMDHCVFITDTDIEMWGTLPIIQVEAVRGPKTTDLIRIYGDEYPKPIAKIDPKNLRAVDPEHDIAIADSFDPSNEVMSTVLENFRTRQPQGPVSARTNAHLQTPTRTWPEGLDIFHD